MLNHQNSSKLTKYLSFQYSSPSFWNLTLIFHGVILCLDLLLTLVWKSSYLVQIVRAAFRCFRSAFWYSTEGFRIHCSTFRFKISIFYRRLWLFVCAIRWIVIFIRFAIHGVMCVFQNTIETILFDLYKLALLIRVPPVYSQQPFDIFNNIKVILPVN